MDEQALQRLTSQLLAQGGNWDIEGINRAEELAGLLLRQGVTDLGQLKLQEYTVEGATPVYEGTGQNMVQVGTTGKTGQRLMYGDKALGYGDLGAIGGGGEYGTPDAQYRGGLLRDDGALATSYAGHGQVSYYPVQGLDGQVRLMPKWGSSSDADTARDVAKGAALIAAAYFGMPIDPTTASASTGSSLLGADAVGSTLAADLAGGSADLAGAMGGGSFSNAGLAATAGGAGAGAASGLTASSLLKYGLPVAGALLGAAGTAKGSTSTQTKEMDPRLANYVYGADGTGGLLGSANKLFADQMATGGLNELQRQGIDLQKNYLLNPAYAAGYTNMMNVGQGLLGAGVASNPFRRG